MVDEDTGRVAIEPADFSKVTGPAVPRAYNVMRDLTHAGIAYHVVGNGIHVDTAIEWYGKDQGLEASLRRMSHGRTVPSIIASCRWEHGRPIIKMARVERSLFKDASEPHLCVPDVGPGFGYCLTECFGNADARSPFLGDPFLLPLSGSARSIMYSIWEVLDDEYKVGIVVKTFPRNGGKPDIVVHNQYPGT